MKKLVSLIWTALLALGLSAQAQTNVITYVDANLTNTTIGGAATNVGVNVTAPDRPNNDLLWGYDNNSNFANPNPTGGAIWAGGTSDGALPELATTITGLTPNGFYEIYAFGWTAGTTWDMSAGLTSGSLTQFRNGPAGDYYALANRFTTVVSDTITVLPNPVDGESKTFATAVEVAEGNRAVYMVQLGSTQANGSGEITAYINVYAGGERTWYDGLGWEEISSLPTVNTHPAAVEAILGDTAVFTVTVDSPLPITGYQWKKNGIDIPGEVTDTLSLTEVDSTDVDSYTVETTNSAGSTLSDPAALTLTLPDVSPAAQLILSGFSANFSITMPVGPAYTYQWYKGISALGGETGSTLALTSVSTSDSGSYTVDVTLSGTTLTSSIGELVVPTVPSATYEATVNADSPVAYWRLGEPALSVTAVDETTPMEDLNIGLNTTLAEPGVILGDPDSSMSFDGTADAPLEEPAHSATLNTANFSVEFWARPTGGSGRRTVVGSTDDTGSALEGYEVGLNAAGQWEFRTGQGAGNAWNTLTGPASSSGWTHVVATFDGTDMNLYVDGLSAGTLASVTYTPQSFWPLRVGDGANEFLLGAQAFTGDIDEVSIYGSALSGITVQDHYAASFDPAALPVIGNTLEDQAVLIGDAASFTVSVLSGSAVTYQWRRAGLDLPGETSATITLDPLVVGDAGDYDCVVTNVNGSDTSNAAALVPLTDYVGTFVLPDDTNTVLNLTGSIPWSGADSAATDTAGLWRQRTVFGILPSLSAHAFQITGTTAGSTVGDTELTTTISGLTPNTDYAVWSLAGHKAGFTNGIQAAFAGDPIKTITIGESIDTGLISVSVADPWTVYHGYLGIETSNGSGEIDVIVDYATAGGRTVYHGLGYQLAVPSAAPPLVTADPIDQTIPVGTDATFAVSVSSAIPVTYQWQKDLVDIPGEVTDTLVVTGVDGTDAAQYRAVITNAQGSVNSAEAYLVPVADLVGNFVFPTSGNTILTRNSSSTFSDPVAATAEAGGLWYENPALGVPGKGSSTHGFQTVANTELAGDAEIQTTISGLDPSETYAVWVLYAYATTADRLTANLAGETPKSFDDSTLNTGLTTNGLAIYHGLLGVTAPNGSGEIDAVSDFQGLTRTMVLGYGYQTAELPLDLTLTIEQMAGDIILTYPNGTLEQSDDLNQIDPWTTVPGAISPHTHTGSETETYFRVVE